MRELFPVGHYLGPFHPGPGQPASHHTVRVGWDTPNLPDQRHRDLWLLAHGRPARPVVPWDRGAVLQAAAEQGIGDPGAGLDELERRGLVVEVETDDGPDRDAFARAHRINALLLGLGNDPVDGVYDAIGTPGAPVLRVGARLFDLWAWGPLSASLMKVAGRLAAQRGTDPAEELTYVLGSLRELLAHGVAFLDRVTALD